MVRLPDDVRRLIDEPNIGHLAVLTPAGPHVSPVWVDRDGDEILVNTAEGRVKARAMRDDARVGLSLTDRDDPYTRVVIQGRVVGFRHDGAVEHMDRLAQKYFGRETFGVPEGQERVIVVIEATHISS